MSTDDELVRLADVLACNTRCLKEGHGNSYTLRAECLAIKARIRELEILKGRKNMKPGSLVRLTTFADTIPERGSKFEYKAPVGKLFALMLLGTVADPRKLTKAKKQVYYAGLQRALPDPTLSDADRVALQHAKDSIDALQSLGFHAEKAVAERWDFATLLRIVRDRVLSWDDKDGRRNTAGILILQQIEDYLKLESEKAMDGSKGPERPESEQDKPLYPWEHYECSDGGASGPCQMTERQYDMNLDCPCGGTWIRKGAKVPLPEPTSAGDTAVEVIP